MKIQTITTCIIPIYILLTITVCYFVTSLLAVLIDWFYLFQVVSCLSHQGDFRQCKEKEDEKQKYMNIYLLFCYKSMIFA